MLAFVAVFVDCLYRRQWFRCEHGGRRWMGWKLTIHNTSAIPTGNMSLCTTRDLICYNYVRVKPTLLILLLYKTAVFDILYNFVVLPAFHSCNINELYCPFVTFIKQFENNFVIEEASKLLLVSFCHIANKMLNSLLVIL